MRDAQLLYKTPSGHVQQSPRYMIELGMTPAARSRVSVDPAATPDPILKITRVILAGPDSGLL